MSSADKNLSFLIVSLAAVATLVLTVVNIDALFTKAKEKPVLGIQDASEKSSESEESDEQFWKNLLTESPDYFEGWVELAKLQIAKGNMAAAELAVDRARLIDPNSPELKELEKLIGS